MLRLLTFFVFFVFCYNTIFCDNLDNSIYNLNTVYTNQNGSSLQLKDLRGDIKIVSMIYTRCKTTCPIIIENMKKIFNLLHSDYKDKVHFVLVSLDPNRDTVQDLVEFGNKKGLDFRFWSLLTGSTDNVLQLAVSLGIKYKKELDGNYVHSNLIIVLDKNGNIRYSHSGLDDNLLKVLKIIYNIV